MIEERKLEEISKLPYYATSCTTTMEFLLRESSQLCTPANHKFGSNTITGYNSDRNLLNRYVLLDYLSILRHW